MIIDLSVVTKQRPAPMFGIIEAIVRTFLTALRSRRDLLLENLALRQQLTAFRARQMSSDNGWGAPRIHGELLMLGFDVSERTVSRYLQRLGRRPEARRSWLTFLHNHREATAAMDLFVAFTVKFRLLYVLFVIRHGRRQIVRFNVTEHPTAAWVIQQLREYAAYHHDDRTHCGLGKQTPMHRTVQSEPLAGAKLLALPRVGGLHHRYEWRDAA